MELGVNRDSNNYSIKLKQNPFLIVSNVYTYFYAFKKCNIIFLESSFVLEILSVLILAIKRANYIYPHF